MSATEDSVEKNESMPIEVDLSESVESQCQERNANVVMPSESPISMNFQDESSDFQHYE
jgi:hypothetical protein